MVLGCSVVQVYRKSEYGDLFIYVHLTKTDTAQMLYYLLDVARQQACIRVVINKVWRLVYI